MQQQKDMQLSFDFYTAPSGRSQHCSKKEFRRIEGFHSMRRYQKDIANKALRANTLVVLPTAAGKTLIAFYLMAHYGRALMLAPTVPLVEQHARDFAKSNLPYAIATGSTNRSKELYSANFVFATPETILNDISIANINSFPLIVFDEAHRARGSYAYVQLAKLYGDSGRVVGLTASPGNSKKAAMEVMLNLNLKHVEVRSYDDVMLYLSPRGMHIHWIGMPQDFMDIINKINALLRSYTTYLVECGFWEPKTKSEFIKLGKMLEGVDGKEGAIIRRYYWAAFFMARAKELAETQSISYMLNYLEGLMKNNTSTIKMLKRNKLFGEVIDMANDMKEHSMDHPKIEALLNYLLEHSGKAIVFVNYVWQAERLIERINEIGRNAALFIGKRKGYGKKKQEETLSKFREGYYDILVSTSIGEEGINIP
ncbi:MAG: DEAD/DEAH box helicase, partial [Methanobacteriota archaeon]